MDWWEQLFHASMWEWGDVATWFTGMLTAGSLWLGFSILRGDRKRQIREQASRVAIEDMVWRNAKEGEKAKLTDPFTYTVRYGTTLIAQSLRRRSSVLMASARQSSQSKSSRVRRTSLFCRARWPNVRWSFHLAITATVILSL